MVQLRALVLEILVQPQVVIHESGRQRWSRSGILKLVRIILLLSRETVHAMIVELKL